MGPFRETNVRRLTAFNLPLEKPFFNLFVCLCAVYKTVILRYNTTVFCRTSKRSFFSQIAVFLHCIRMCRDKRVRLFRLGWCTNASGHTDIHGSAMGPHDSYKISMQHTHTYTVYMRFVRTKKMNGTKHLKMSIQMQPTERTVQSVDTKHDMCDLLAHSITV